MNPFLNHPLVKLLFFGNYFYGICAIALSIEAALQQRESLNDGYYYLLSFSLTVLYYSKAYLNIEVSDTKENIRGHWYALHKKRIVLSLWFFALLALLLITRIYLTHSIVMLHLNSTEYILILIFPLTGILYYGINSKSFQSYNLRNIGWLKPFIIGFIWAGAVTVYPVLYQKLIYHRHYEINLIVALLFLKNFMFVSVLAILFDVKDYAKDYNQELKTVVVKMGLRKTIFNVILPLCLLGLSSFIAFGIIRNFHWMKIFLNTIPFLLTIYIAFTLQKRQSIFYYLIIIDGLMLLKALLGITAILYF